MTAEQWNWPYM